MTDSQLIFIGGLPRSGTTLIQALLSNSPHSATSPESWLMLTLSSMIKPDLFSAKFDFDFAYDATSEAIFKKTGIDHISLVRELALKFYDKVKGDKRVFIDKTPRYYELLNELREIFPRAKIVIVKRHPKDIVRSFVKKRKIISTDELLWNHRDLLYGPRMILDFELTDKEVIAIHYEDIVSKPVETSKLIFDRLGLDFDKDYCEALNTQALKGKYGDLNIHNSNSIRNQDEPVYISDEISDFIDGYLNYLGADFLDDYGYSSDIEYPQTQSFQKFLDKVKTLEMEWDRSIYVHPGSRHSK